ncbi:MAG: homoserine kinase [Leptolinea sp.]
MSASPPSIQIRIPATSANLGSGFDCLAVALNLWNQALVEFTGREYQVRIEGEGEGILPETDENLILKAFRFTLSQLNIDPPDGVVFHCENHIPLGSGLGSSATAVLIGVVAATALKPEFETKENWLQLSAELEGHADNVAAAIYGGLVAVRKEESGFKVSLFNIEPESAVVVLPIIDLPTKITRAALPKTIPMKDAVYNLSRIPAILEGFRLGDADVLRAGLDDRLHQPYRLPLIPGSEEAIKTANQMGAAAALSGAGPSVIVFFPEDMEEIASAIGNCFQMNNLEFRVFNLALINRGALISRV